jgi:hypothetical protein
MNVLHNSDISAYNPSCDLKVYIVEAFDNIHSKYQELSDFLLEKIIINSLILMNICHITQYKNIFTSKICNSIFL